MANNTLTQRITVSADDGFITGGAVTDNSTIQMGGGTFGATYDAFLRYPDIPIARKSRIVTAKVTFEASQTASGAVDVNIYGEKVADAVVPTDGTDYDGKSRTTAVVNWLPANWTSGVTYDTDSLVSIIQEIVNQSGWSAGNALQILIDENSSGTNRRFAEGFDTDSAAAPLLTVEYFPADVLAINGNQMLTIGRPDWVDSSVGAYLSGETIVNRYRRHVWQTNVMSAADYNTLYALEGQKVSIQTTNYSDRNGIYVTYHNADLRRVTGQHNGPFFENVRAEFVIGV